MSSPKGFSDQKKSGQAQHSTVNPVSAQQVALDVNSFAFVREVATGAVEANSTTTVLNATAHPAQIGDIVRFTSGALNTKDAIVVATTANTITFGEALASAPVTSVTYRILRHVKPVLDSSGALPTSATFSGSISTGPVQYNLNGAATNTSQDTSTPANSRPLPVTILDSTGNVQGSSAKPLRTDPTGTTTQPVSAAALPLPAGAATSAKQPALGTAGTASADVITVQGIASMTALKTDGSGVTQPVSAAALPLPAGAATSAKQDTQITNIGDVVEAAPASDTASSGLNGRLQRLAQRLTSLIALFPASIGQKTAAGSISAVLASDQGAVPASQSGTWTVQPGNTANTTAWLVKHETISTATLTNVASSATSVSVLASTAGRKGALFFNDSTATCYLKYGTTASTTSHTVQIPPGGYFEMSDVRAYTGAIDAIWSAANGALRVTELT